MRLYLSLLTLIAFATFAVLAEDVGDKCVPNSQLTNGMCTLLSDCEEAIRSIRKKNYHRFQRCGFSGDQEVVCCPEAENKFGSTERPRTTERISDRECRKIASSRIEPLDLHIIGGEVASIGEFPHMVRDPTDCSLCCTVDQGGLCQNSGEVAIGFDRGSGYEFDCGGSLISPNYVLTAAHCIDTLDRIEPSMVRVGVVSIGGNRWDDETDVRIANIATHPDYTRKEKYHDLALLRLERSLQFSSNLNAACLYTSDEDPTIPLTVTGWGQTSTATERRSRLLLKANVTVVPRSRCGESYTNWRKLPKGISSDQLCAGDPDGLKDTCQGDSGGPLQGVTSNDGQYRVVGVTSFGRGCGSPVPGVYTSVSRYLTWIENTVWKSRK